MPYTIQDAKDKGISMDGAVGFLTEDTRRRLAMDAAMITAPNAGVPAAISVFLDPKTIEILLAPRNASLIFNEVKKGDWVNSHAMFKMIELTGGTTPYTDYGRGAAADVNVTFPTREQYVFQTNISYGVREQAVTALAMIDLASQKQRSAATTIAIDANKFNLFGVEGREIYGLLNDPNLPPADPATTPWAEATDPLEIYSDILEMSAVLENQSNGLIDSNSELILVVSPDCNVWLKKPNEHGITPLKLVGDNFANCKVVVLPEMRPAGQETSTVMLLAKSVLGEPVAEFAFGEKYRALQLIPQVSSWEQKVIASTYGCILYRPFAVALKTGV
jgi:hypothetical protein